MYLPLPQRLVVVAAVSVVVAVLLVVAATVDFSALDHHWSPHETFWNNHTEVHYLCVNVAAELLLLNSFVYASVIRLQFGDWLGCVTLVARVARLADFHATFEKLFAVIYSKCGAAWTKFKPEKVLSTNAHTTVFIK